MHERLRDLTGVRGSEMEVEQGYIRGVDPGMKVPGGFKGRLQMLSK